MPAVPGDGDFILDRLALPRVSLGSDLFISLKSARLAVAGRAVDAQLCTLLPCCD